jgi:phosphatidylinositol kinase/protein kinase (PI-3  family)
LVNEKIDEVTNPIVLEYQKEQFQKLSDDMKLSYENELKMRKDEERLKEERVQKLNEEKGFSVNSFPID